MSATTDVKKPANDTPRIGEFAALQPLSGVSVIETSAVNGLGNGAFTREAEKKKA